MLALPWQSYKGQNQQFNFPILSLAINPLLIYSKDIPRKISKQKRIWRYLRMKHLNLRNVLLALTLVFFMQHGSILLPDLPEDPYSDEEMISPQNDKPNPDTHVD